MIDIHCHILPQIDDGASSMAEAVELCRIAEQNGITHAIATPHLIPMNGIEEFVEQRDERIERLKSAIAEENIKLNILAGAEIYVDDDIFYAPKLDKVTLAGSCYCLIEFAFSRVGFSSIVRYIKEIRSRGLEPIIAHPERYEYMQRDWNLINRLIDMGVLFQINSSSLLGASGLEAQKLALAMVQTKAASFIASDAHSVVNRPNDLLRQSRAFPEIEVRRLYSEMLNELPQKIIENEDFEQ